MISDTALGYISVVLSVIFFGSCMVPLKLKSVQEANVDPAIFQTYACIAIVASSFLVLTYQPFQFTAWGILGAGLWLPCSILAIICVRKIGISIGQSLWSCITVIVSFIFGATMFHEEPNSWPLTVLGLLLLIGSIIGISLSNSQFTVALPSQMEWVYRLNWLVIPPKLIVEGNDRIAGEIQIDDSTKLEIDYNEIGAKTFSSHMDIKNEVTINDVQQIIEPKKSKVDLLIGFGAAILLGVLNGSVMVPTKLSSNSVSGIVYIVSFAIGVAIFTVVMFVLDLLYHFILHRSLPNFAVKKVAIPGLITGIVWNLGNYFSIYATLYLGLTIGYPLTQCALVVAALWGMIFYREFTRLSSIVQFFVAVAALLAGAALLSVFGAPRS